MLQQGSEQVQQHGCAIEQQQPTLGASTSSIISPPQELLQWHLSQQNGEASVVSNTTVWQGLIVELAAPHENTIVLDPDITKTKGRMRTRRKKLALEVHSKRKPNRCSACGSIEHNAATCRKKRSIEEK